MNTTQIIIAVLSGVADFAAPTRHKKRGHHQRHQRRHQHKRAAPRQGLRSAPVTRRDRWRVSIEARPPRKQDTKGDRAYRNDPHQRGVLPKLHKEFRSGKTPSARPSHKVF
jgi:hypothetical protein